MISGVKKILVFKLCCFGDTVFMTPAIWSLKQKFSDAEIFYAYSDWVKTMMKYLEDIDGTIEFENVYSKSFLKKIAGTLKFIRNVRKMNFDLVMYGHRSNLLSFILRLCGIKYRLGFEGTKFLTHTAPFNDTLPEYERYKTVLSTNGIKTDDTLPFLKKTDNALLRKKQGFLSDDTLIGIFPCGGTNPGTNMPIKRWGLDNYFKLAQKINTDYPEAKIIFYQGKQESEKYSVPDNIIASTATIDNDCLSCCDFFISNDTGSLHIAAAFGVSTISVFGPTDPRILAPANPPGEPGKHAYVWNHVECSPCYTPKTAIERDNPKYWDGNNFICHTGTHICMKSISAEEVFETVKMMIGRHEAVSV